MDSIGVGIIGATGNIGSSIVNALLDVQNTRYCITALCRPSSADKPAAQSLRHRGITVLAADLSGPEEPLVRALTGLDIVIVCLPPGETAQQIQLINAASKAGVKRFIPNAWAVIAPAQDIMIRDWKEEVYNHLKQRRVPYTIIDCGVWHEVVIPRVPSGKFDHAALMGRTFLVGKGDVKCATTAIVDIGMFVSRIISDPRTLNKSVFAYGQHVTQIEYISVAEEMTGEKVRCISLPAEKVVTVARRPQSERYGIWHKVIVQYLYNNWVRGDTESSYAKYLGYLDAWDLYPDMKVKSLRESMQEALAGGRDFAAGVGTDSFWQEVEYELQNAYSSIPCRNASRYGHPCTAIGPTRPEPHLLPPARLGNLDAFPRASDWPAIA